VSICTSSDRPPRTGRECDVRRFASFPGGCTYLYLASGPQARYKGERVTTDCPPSPNFAGLSILVVDDDKDNRSFLLSEVPGWAAYFQKPVDMNQFLETVATILKVPRDPGMSS